jgi:DNA-directed RNA polymerase specialized sigma24 family protein
MSGRSADVERIGKDWPRIRLALVSLGRRCLDKRADAEDLAHTVFVRVWSGQTEWKNTWSDHPERALFVMMKNERRAEIRHGRVVDHHSVSVAYEIEHEIDGAPEPFFAALDQRERDSVVGQLRELLEKGSRDAQVLEAILDGKDGNKDVAEHLHITEEEVKNARRAILKVARERLGIANMVGAGPVEDALLRRTTAADQLEITEAERAALEELRSATRAMLVDALLAQGM